MKRLLAVLMICVLVCPMGAHADGNPVVKAETFGDGWSVEVTSLDDPADSSWAVRYAYFGPNGNRAMILVYELGDSIVDRSRDWDAVKIAMTVYSGATEEMIEAADPSVTGIAAADFASDALRFACLDLYGRVCATSAYASSQHPVALIVRVDGAVNELTDIAATDYVAGLYFAALSGQ